MEALLLLSSLALGLSAGALAAEGAVLVPYWQSLTPRDFFAWYADNAARLLRFFGPLEAVAALLALAAAVLGSLSSARSEESLWAAAILALGVLLAFPLYFQKANSSFERASLAEDELPAELRRWAQWHWVRTVLATAAFGVSLLAIAP